MTKPTIGFIGLGDIGEAMAGRLPLFYCSDNISACTMLKMPSGNATMAMPLGRDPIGGGVGL
jgi:phosphoglycerate dehydrogenase-like enzyme